MNRGSPRATEGPATRETTTRIGDHDTGRWTLTTETGSHYLLDLDDRTLTRRPRTGSETRGYRLRGDHEAGSLYQVIDCELGSSAYFLVGVEAGVVTLRITSPVTKIEPGR